MGTPQPHGFLVASCGLAIHACDTVLGAWTVTSGPQFLYLRRLGALVMGDVAWPAVPLVTHLVCYHSFEY